MRVESDLFMVWVDGYAWLVIRRLCSKYVNVTHSW